MIKIERRKTDKAEAAKVALEQAKERDSGCNISIVNAALKEIFYGKCYICENKEITSYQIEHLIPHGGNKELKYDWNNLFWSCAHCNNTKLNKYDPILDCTQEDVESLIAFRKHGYFGTDERLEFIPLCMDKKVLNTVQLLEDVYYGKTPQKQLEAKLIRKKLRIELSNFKEYVREYMEAEDKYEKEDLLYLIKKELADNSAFTAFKRWLIKDNNEKYAELVDSLQAV